MKRSEGHGGWGGGEAAMGWGYEEGVKWKRRIKEKEQGERESAVWGGGIKRHLNAELLKKKTEREEGREGHEERKDCEGIAH